MNKKTKLFLLLTAIFISIGSILYFYTTIIEPPVNLKFENKHTDEVKVSIHLLDKFKNDASRDSLFNAIQDKIEFYLAESYINSDDRDILMENLVNKFTPKFINSSFAKFSQSKWDEKDHRWMERNISELKLLKFRKGSEILVQGDFNRDLNSILEVIQQYNSAKNIAIQTKFNNITDAQNKISNAKKYAELEYLKNCTSLVDELYDVPLKIENNHFSYLHREVKQLEGYRNYNQSNYNTLAKSIRGEIIEYKDNAKNIYNRVLKEEVKEIKEIEDRAAQYNNQAKTYYESLKTNTLSKQKEESTPNKKVTITHGDIEVFNPEYTTTSNNHSCKIVKVEFTDYITKVDFEYTNLDTYGGWCSIDPDTYIQITKGGKKYKLRFTDKIHKSPRKNEFSYKNEKLNFTLFFSSIPQNISQFDLIEPGNSDWKFYSIKLK